MIPIIDAHQDIAYNALAKGRDIRVSVHVTRERERLQFAQKGQAYDLAMSGLPELRQGGFMVVAGVIFAQPLSGPMTEDGDEAQGYLTPEEAYRIGQEQLAYYHTLVQETGITLIENKADLQGIIKAWKESAVEDRQRPLGIIITMEGADPIRTPAEVPAWYAGGLRVVAPAWSGTRYSGGTAAPGPLTSAGRMLLQEMERVGLMLDVSHMAEESFWQALEQFQGHIIASHSNCRAITPTDRHLTDDMIRALIQRDGVIGVVPFNLFLHPAWSRTQRFPIGLEHLVRHIDHICQISGNTYHVGLGSDIDGGFGRDEMPVELETVADLSRLASTLASMGYEDNDIHNIFHGNWQRFFLTALPGSASL